MRKALSTYPAILCLIFTYAILSLVNLESLPVAWTDEVLNLDPAIQQLQSGTYTSKLWPNPNSDVIFASYLPAIQWFQSAYLRIVPIEIFWVRLPFALLTWGSIILGYFIIRKNSQLNDFWASIWVGIAFLDKSVFELSRSMRVEPIIIFGILLLFYWSPKRKLWWIKSLLIGYLAMAHVYIWPFLFIWFLKDWISLTPIKKALSAAFTLMAPFLFLKSLNFNLNTLFEQMGFHAQHHTLTQTDLPHNPLLNSLWYRFYPYYFEQALNPVILYGMILMIFGFFIKQKMWRKPNDWIYGSWILGILIIFTVLTPQYRYLPIFWISGILLLIQSKRVNFMAPAIKGIALLLFVNLSFSFLGRHSAALIQAKSRNPVYVYDFLHKYLPNPKKNRTLILGESIGFYYAHRGRNHHTFDYGIDFYPQHFNWSDYDHIVLLSHEVRPQDSLIAIYESPKESFKTPTTMKAFAKGGTYDGMRVYSLK